VKFKTLEYNESNNTIVVLDQKKLPAEVTNLTLGSVDDVVHAIRAMTVRGAPLIGVTAAYGLVLASVKRDRAAVLKAADAIKAARPTAVNLGWAVERMKKILNNEGDMYHNFLKEARRIEKEDKDSCRMIGENGAHLITENSTVMVHCNAGALATSGIGTALAVLYTAQARHCRFRVYVNETRPLLQGSRLTAWELTVNGIETHVMCDNMAATYMPETDIVLVGADRIAANGDTANKTGTHGLAIIAKHFNVPLYIAAPSSSFDLSMASGKEIPVEIRHDKEIRCLGGTVLVPNEAGVHNPAFDITPASLITGIITEIGLIEQPTRESVETHFSKTS
jgi:methylthioribose-1-phosphate isomerase